MIQTPVWWLFLLVVPAGYWLVPANARRWLLLVTSLGVLSVFAAADLALMLVVAGLVFGGLRLNPDRWPAVIVALGRSVWLAWLVLGYLVTFKYLPAVATAVMGQGGLLDLAVPLGISYFCFKLLHYVIEMRRGNFPPHGLADFGGWLFLAPIFTAGPIERFDHYLSHRSDQKFERRFIVEGTLRIIIGLSKKFFVGVLVLKALENVSGGGMLALSADPTALPPYQVWAALGLTLLYVYLDFSAYSDIAIGSSRLFGLTIMENFNMPFLATNLQNFWQRWHMSLANWCRAYIYMPMIGLTRNPYSAIIATFATMGLWHAASPHWIIWGLWHGIGLAVMQAWVQFANRRRIKIMKSRGGKIAGWAITMAFVALGGAFTVLHGQGSVMASVGLIAAAFGVAL